MSAPRLRMRLKWLLLCAMGLAAVFVLQFLVKHSVERGHVWTTHIVAQSPEVWDWVHTNGQQMGPGGIWKYGANMLSGGTVKYVTAQPRYERLVDMSCSVGIVLSALQHNNPAAEHFGSDISRVMVNETRRRCPRSHAAQFDLGRFRQPAGDTVDYVFPGTFDYVIISDVLIYIAWGDWPPLLLRWCAPCRHMALGEQRRWLDRVKALTRREIVFSSHQNNPIAIEMLTALGAKMIGNETTKLRDRVYIINGTAAVSLAPSR